MRRIGLIGGMSWESTALYYQSLNEGVRARLGGLATAEILLWTFDFANIEQRQRENDWERMGNDLASAALRLEAAGAEAILLCCNTMHLPIARTERDLAVPFLHIADVVAEALTRNGHSRPLLLGGRFTMEQPFYRERLGRFGIDAVVPVGADFELVDRVIYTELCKGAMSPDSRAGVAAVIARGASEEGVDSVILGCTELGLLIGPDDSVLPIYDSTALHVEAALAFAFSER